MSMISVIVFSILFIALGSLLGRGAARIISTTKPRTFFIIAGTISVLIGMVLPISV